MAILGELLDVAELNDHPGEPATSRGRPRAGPGVTHQLPSLCPRSTNEIEDQRGEVACNGKVHIGYVRRSANESRNKARVQPIC